MVHWHTLPLRGCLCTYFRQLGGRATWFDYVFQINGLQETNTGIPVCDIAIAVPLLRTARIFLMKIGNGLSKGLSCGFIVSRREDDEQAAERDVVIDRTT